MPSDPLSLWKDDEAKATILRFVVATTEGGPDYVAPVDRFAVFENDGTLGVSTS